MDRQSVTVTTWIDQLAGGNQQAAEQLWQHISVRLKELARQKLDPQTRRRYDENNAANSAFHSLCRSLANGRLTAENRDALWGLLAVITSRKISAQRRYLTTAATMVLRIFRSPSQPLRAHADYINWQPCQGLEILGLN